MQKLIKSSFLAALALIVSVASLDFAFAQKVEPINEVFSPPELNYDPALYGKVAVVQWAVDGYVPSGPAVTPEMAEAFKQTQREVLAMYIRQAAGNGAKLIVTPEFGILGYPDIPEMPPEHDEYRSRDDIAPYVETVPGPTTTYFGALAQELGVYIHVGFAEVDSVDQRYYNVVVAIAPTGEVVAKYRKVNLYMQENDFLSPGTLASSYDSPFGMIGLLICADIYSSFPMSAYLASNIKVLALSTSWAAWNSGMNSFRAGAIRNNAYVLAANQDYFPDSGVINPDGTTQSHIRQSKGVAYGFLPYKAPAQIGQNPAQSAP